MNLKRLVIFAALFFLLSTAIIFSNAEGEGSGDQLEITMLYADNASYPVQDDWIVWQLMEEATGVKLNRIVAPDSAAYFEAKKNVIIASGDLPEIIYTKFFPTPQDIANGVLLPIDEYMHMLPNFSQFIEDNNYTEEIEFLTGSDGHFYILPVKAGNDKYTIHGWMIRTDILEKHDLEQPQTLDEVYELALVLKELYPDVSPIINRFGAGNILKVLSGGFGTAAGWSLGSNGHTYNAETNSFIFAPSTDEYKELLMWVKKCYDSGVLDQEFGSMSSATYEQLAVQGKTFIFIDWIGNHIRYNIHGKQVNGSDFQVSPFIPPTGPSGNYAVPRGRKYEQMWMLPMSLVDHPQFEQVMAYIDWFYTEEASIITTFGKEGVTFERRDDHLYFTDPDIDQSREHGLMNNTFNVRLHPDYFVAVNGPEIGEQFEQMLELEVWGKSEPRVRYTEEQSDELQLLIPNLLDYYYSMTHKFIYGEESFDDWDIFTQTCEEKGASEIGAIVNEAWRNN